MKTSEKTRAAEREGNQKRERLLSVQTYARKSKSKW